MPSRRKPRPERVVFFPTPHAAARAGFRACKRCRPELAGGPAEAERRLAERALAFMREHLEEPLTLAGIGLYAVIAFAVTRRTRELGVRMALGAGSRQVVWSVSRDMAVLVAAGTAVGLALWVVAVQVMRVAPVQTSGVANIQLYQPDVDPLAMLLIATFTGLVGVLASFVHYPIDDKPVARLVAARA